MYQQYYKLIDKPFRLSADPKMFFNSYSHKRALSYLLYGVKQGDGFIVVTGDVGMGKTMLASALSGMLEGQNVVIGKIVTTQLEAEDLLRVAAAEFGLAFRTEPKAVLLKALESYFKECARLGKRVLLVVDEVQNLPPRSVEELRMLSNFQAHGRPLVQSFLLGQKEFRNILRSSEFVQLRQRVIAAYHLRPLDIEETRGYIEHRLKLVGWNQDPVIADNVFPLIHRVTQGVPRKINILCDRLLLFGCLEERHSLDADALKAVAEDLKQEDLFVAPEESAAVRDQAPRAVAAGQNSRQVPEERRIDALETSLESLGNMVRRELVMLRKALLDTQKVRSTEIPVLGEAQLGKSRASGEKD